MTVLSIDGNRNSDELELRIVIEVMPHCRQRLLHESLFSLAFTVQVFCLGANCFATSQTSCASIRATQDDALRAALKALQENRLEDALRDLDVAKSVQPSDAQIRNFRGIVLVRLTRNSEAAQEYQEAIRLDPNLEDAYKNLGFLKWTEHDLENARVQLERAVELAPDDSFAHYYLGRVELDSGLYESAFEQFDRSGLAWPQDPQFLIAATKGYLALGKQEAAHKVIHRLANMQLNDSETAVLARVLLSAGDHARAIDVLRGLKESQNATEHRWAHLDLALCYLTAGRYENAAAESHILLQTPHFAGASAAEKAAAWSTIGIARARLSRADSAIEAFRQAAKLDSGREEYWLNLTRELMDLDRYAEAISVAQDALNSNPKSYALHLRLGAAYLSSDRYPEAENVFRKLVAAGDPLPTSYVGLAQVLLRTGRAEEAVSELAVARKKLGANFLISYFQGLALDRAAKAAEAVAAFQEAIQLSPNSAEAQLGLGKAELAIGRNDNAIADLQRTLRLDPANVQARRLLAQAYRRIGDSQASRYSQQITEKEAAPRNDLVGDFILPEWQNPRESSQQ